jgi:hypothetical protein
MLNSSKSYEKAKQRKAKIDKKDTKYVLKYINKQIKEACKQGKFYIVLDNKIPRENLFFCETHYCYIDRLPKVTDMLCYVKGYNIERFTRHLKDKIKISWEKQKKGI